MMLDFARSSGADGITLWMLHDEVLQARVNPIEPDIVGASQPLSAGLISRVYLTGQAILENDPGSNPHHDPSVDRRLGRRCTSLMAAAVDDGGDGGVVSAVTLEKGSSREGFVFSDLERLARLAGEIGSILRQPR